LSLQQNLPPVNQLLIFQQSKMLVG
jgi:hypothetical protein